MDNQNLDCLNHVTEGDVKGLVMKYGYNADEVSVDKFCVVNASDNMLGFLCDYWRLKVYVSLNNEKRKIFQFFIKAVSKSNAAKAKMVREMQLFQKEVFFYSVLKEKMEVRDLRPWSPRFITALDESLVFEDLNEMQYQHRNKFDRFDTDHTLRALESLARFHASSIILEENKSKVLGRRYIIQEQFEQFLDKGGYHENDIWFQQCMIGALEAVKAFSKYNTEQNLQQIESKWKDIWNSALSLSNFSDNYRNVICHRDLWNNNLLFHYEKIGDALLPDDCLMVDFQAVRCQPPAGDVMLLLYCNLDPKFREQNMTSFLIHYYEILKEILSDHHIDIDNILPNAQFVACAEEQRLWGIIVCACLIPQFWIKEELITKTFNDTTQFDDILCKDKGSFIVQMMEINPDYKEKVIEIFDEIVERYCLRD